MITFRRTLIDNALERAIPLMQGRVLDIGGKRGNRRGRFNPPLENVVSWHYLNSDPSTEPDYCCSAESVPLENESLDTVVMTEVMEYLQNPEKALKEIHRILVPGGVCLVSTPHLVPIHGDYWADRQRFTALKLREMFTEAGFGNVEIEAMGSLGAVLSDIFHVATGYAQEGQRSFLCRAIYKIIKLFKPVFGWLDIMTDSQKKYITTGYFITARKR